MKRSETIKSSRLWGAGRVENRFNKVTEGWGQHCSQNKPLSLSHSLSRRSAGKLSLLFFSFFSSIPKRKCRKYINKVIKWGKCNAADVKEASWGRELMAITGPALSSVSALWLQCWAVMLPLTYSHTHTHIQTPIWRHFRSGSDTLTPLRLLRLVHGSVPERAILLFLQLLR